MKEDKIFNLNDLSDIPAEIHDNLKIIKIHEEGKKLLSLFDIKKELSLDEILVGYFRKFGKIKDRAWVSSNLYNWTRSKLITRVPGKKGVYKK